MHTSNRYLRESYNDSKTVLNPCEKLLSVITAEEESDGQDSSVVRRPIVIVSMNDTIGASTVRRPLKRQGLERKSGATDCVVH